MATAPLAGHLRGSDGLRRVGSRGVPASHLLPARLFLPAAPHAPGHGRSRDSREVATLVMLLGVAMLAGTERWDRFLAFCVTFGVWYLFYYVWLWLLLGWPPSLLTWDVLFLIPVPWIGPVLAPAVVSSALVIGGLLLLRKG